MPKSFFLSTDIHEYLVAHGAEPDALQRELIEATADLGGVSAMQVSPEQGSLIGLLVKLIGTEFAVEVGTFTGYSTLCIARSLAPDGRLIACDVSDEWTDIASRFWERDGVADRIDLRIAPALETIEALPDRPVDFAFVDANKDQYVDYYEALVPRMRPGGLLMIDNVLWSGLVVDPDADDDMTQAIRDFNDHVVGDDRVESVMLPVADGITLIRVKS